MKYFFNSLTFEISNIVLCLVNNFFTPNWNQIRLFHGAHKNVMLRHWYLCRHICGDSSIYVYADLDDAMLDKTDSIKLIKNVIVVFRNDSWFQVDEEWRCKILDEIFMKTCFMRFIKMWRKNFIAFFHVDAKREEFHIVSSWWFDGEITFTCGKDVFNNHSRKKILFVSTVCC